MTTYTVIDPTNQERDLMYKIESYLSEMTWPTVLSSSTRRNIGSTKRHAFCLGSVRKLDVFGELVHSQYNKKHPLLLSMLKKLMSLRDPNFKYTTIQLNSNLQTNPHYDKNNIGVSYCLALGKHTGGGLALYSNGANDSVPNVVNNKRKWVQYDGSKILHGSAPVKSGNRYAIIYFKCKPRYRRK
jgi:hypothetical protein